jgi:hypothetical protein
MNAQKMRDYEFAVFFDRRQGEWVAASTDIDGTLLGYIASGKTPSAAMTAAEAVLQKQRKPKR